MQNPSTRKWWLWYGALVFGIPFFVFMTVFWGIVLFVVTSLPERRLDWRFYANPQTHADGLLASSLVISLLAGCYWGFHMCKFFESKRQYPESEIKS
ncbi:MAG TPA: hypothetical protein VN861_06085 [Candidatus Acidoferrales bacterium]|nr:hypothetical protein [Candidatus Acidoferrales bacterium]